MEGKTISSLFKSKTKDFLCSSLLLWGLTFSCKTSSPRSASELKHTWGETKRSVHNLNCQEEISFDPFFQDYIRKHLEKIAKSNPTVFQDELNHGKFCIMPIDSNEIDAGAVSDGSLFINTGLLQVTNNDAQFATAVAHELAHITLNHGNAKFEEFVSQNPQYSKLSDQIKAQGKVIEALKSELDVKLKTIGSLAQSKALVYIIAYEDSFIKKQFKELSSKVKLQTFDACEILSSVKKEPIKDEKLSKLQADLTAQMPSEIIPEIQSILSSHCNYLGQKIMLDYRSRSLFSNWIETEADEVGYEFFLRAGYSSKEYSDFYRNINRHFAGSETIPTDCVRGEEHHPRDCWRAQNALNELTAHAAEYSHIMPAYPVINVFGEDLNTLRAKYRQPAPQHTK